MENSKLGSGGWVLIIGLFIIFVIFIMPAMLHLDRETYTVTITEKAVKKHDKEDRYLVYAKTEDGRTMVFENTDTWLEWKFKSSDVQGSLIIGEKYKVKAYGWRIGMFSMYPNIVKAEWVK